MSVLPKLNYEFNSIPVSISAGFWVGLGDLILWNLTSSFQNVYGKCRKSKIAKTLSKNRVGEFAYQVPGCTYSKATLSKQCFNAQGQANRAAEQRAGKQAHAQMDTWCRRGWPCAVGRWGLFCKCCWND